MLLGCFHHPLSPRLPRQSLTSPETAQRHAALCRTSPGPGPCGRRVMPQWQDDTQRLGDCGGGRQGTGLRHRGSRAQVRNPDVSRLGFKNSEAPLRIKMMLWGKNKIDDGRLDCFGKGTVTYVSTARKAKVTHQNRLRRALRNQKLAATSPRTYLVR